MKRNLLILKIINGVLLKIYLVDTILIVSRTVSNIINKSYGRKIQQDIVDVQIAINLIHLKIYKKYILKLKNM